MLYVGIDFETHLISEAYPAPKPVCLSYYFVDSNKEVKADVLVKDKIEIFLRKILESNETRIIAHNATFEMLVIYEWYPFLRKALKEKLSKGHIICTQIYQVLADNALGNFNNKYSLADLVKEYYKIELNKGEDTWRLRYADLEHIPVVEWPKEAIDYSIDDSKWCYKVHMEHQQTIMNIKPEVSIEASFYLNLAGNFGMRISPDRVNQLESEIQNILQPHYDALIQGKFADIKKGKFRKFNKVFGNLLKEKLDDKYLIYTPKGGLKLTEEALSVYIANCNDPYVSSIITAFISIAEYEKVKTAFIARLKNTELIRTTYNSVVRSGRTSSRTSNIYPSVNIQQMPRKVENVTWDIRNCFIPRSGYVICSIDYSGLELASCAHRLGTLTTRHDMRDLLNKGTEPTDLHSILGARIKSSKEGTPITADAFTLKKKESGYKEYRQLAKPINLGFPGGIGYEVMRTTLAKEGINLGFKVLDRCKIEFPLLIRSKELRAKGYDVRVRQTKWNEFQLVYDELVGIKRQMFSIYPDLEYFLSEGHSKYLNGKTKMVKNDFGVWEKEELYDFSLDGFSRKNVTYTEFCNGTLMQSPSAIGAKKAFIATQKEFLDGDEVNVLAFIHDEILFEIKNNENLIKNVERASEIMIDSMKETLYTVRIAVEAEVSNHWQKAGGFYTKAYWKDYNSNILKSK